MRISPRHIRLCLLLALLTANPVAGWAEGDCQPSINLALVIHDEDLADRTPLQVSDPLSLIIHGRIEIALAATKQTSPSAAPVSETGFPLELLNRAEKVILSGAESLCLGDQDSGIALQARNISNLGIETLPETTLALDESGQRAARLIIAGGKITQWEAQARVILQKKDPIALKALINEIDSFLAARSVEDTGEDGLEDLYYGAAEIPGDINRNTPIIRGAFGLFPIQLLKARLSNQAAMLAGKSNLAPEYLEQFDPINARIETYIRPETPMGVTIGPRSPNPLYLDFLANYYQARSALDWLELIESQGAETWRAKIIFARFGAASERMETIIGYQEIPFLWAVHRALVANFHEYLFLSHFGLDDAQGDIPAACAARANAELAQSVITGLDFQSINEDWCQTP